MGIGISGVEVTIVNTAGADTRAIAAYIQKQLEDQAVEQLTFKEYIDPFTGSRNEQARK